MRVMSISKPPGYAGSPGAASSRTRHGERQPVSEPAETPTIGSRRRRSCRPAPAVAARACCSRRERTRRSRRTQQPLLLSFTVGPYCRPPSPAARKTKASPPTAARATRRVTRRRCARRPSGSSTDPSQPHAASASALRRSASAGRPAEDLGRATLLRPALRQRRQSVQRRTSRPGAVRQRCASRSTTSSVSTPTAALFTGSLIFSGTGSAYGRASGLRHRRPGVRPSTPKAVSRPYDRRHRAPGARFRAHALPLIEVRVLTCCHAADERDLSGGESTSTLRR